MYPTRLALSDKAIVAFHFAPSGQRIIRDTQLPGFFVMIGKRTKTFMAQGDLRVNGKRQSIRIKVGEVGEIKTREARAKAKELLGSIAKGVDPPPKTKPLSDTRSDQADQHQRSHLARRMDALSRFTPQPQRSK
ncbi:MAG TPA: Arm DNA-binding domain-containing protein [Xanthobacteraceae bacterium]|jgi:hypothetical protein